MRSLFINRQPPISNFYINQNRERGCKHPACPYLHNRMDPSTSMFWPECPRCRLFGPNRVQCPWISSMYGPFHSPISTLHLRPIHTRRIGWVVSSISGGRRALRCSGIARRLRPGHNCRISDSLRLTYSILIKEGVGTP